MSTKAAALPVTMKAMQFSSVSGGLEHHLKLNPAATPPSSELSADQIYVELISMALNAFDYKLPEIPFLGGWMVNKPASPGVDYCGRVVLAGSNAALKPGEIVFGRLDAPTKFGTLGQYITAPRAGAAPVPTGIDPDHAAAAGMAALAAYQCIVPNVKSGDRIFINGGSGGAGVFGIQIAKVKGCRVTTSCSTANVELCRQLGADEVIDYKTSDVSQELKAKGPVFSLVVDNVGAPDDLYAAANDYLKVDGKFIQVGAAMSLSGVWKFLSRMTRPAILGGGKRKFEFFHGENREKDFAQIAQWMQEGKVKAILDSTYEFEDAAEAYKKLKTGRARGKIVVHVTRNQSQMT